MKKIRAGIAKFLARAAVVAYLGWDAGIYWNPRRGQVGWPWQGAQTPDQANDPMSRIEIIRKAQHFERNNWFAIALGEVWTTYTVGSGMVIRPASSDQDWNEKRKALWDRWCELPDSISTQDFDSFQQMVGWRVFFDGCGYIYKTRGDNPPYRPRIQFIEAAMVQTPPEMFGRTDIFDGVERDSRGRRVAYHVHQNINGVDSFIRIPAASIIPVGEFTRPGEVHPFSYLASVLDDIQDLKELANYAMDKAKEAAEIKNVYETHDGDIPTSEELIRANRELTTETVGKNTQTVSRLEQVRKTLGPKSVGIQVGEKIYQLKSESPNEIEQGHWRIAVERACAGVRIPVLLILPASIQGTVARAVLDHANTFFRTKSKMFQKAFAEVYRYVTEQESFIEISIADKPADWRKCSIRQPRGCNVDIGRNSAAMIAELEAGATTYEEIYEPLGLDAYEELEIKAKGEAFIDELCTKYKLTPDRIRASIGESLKLQMQSEANNRTQQDNAPA